MKSASHRADRGDPLAGEVNVLLLCIAFSNHEAVCQFVANALESDSADRIRVVVVEQTQGGSADDISWLTGAALHAWHGGQLLVAGDGRNRGYFGGFREGLAAAASAWQMKFDWVILANTDIEIISKDWVSLLERHAPVAGVVGVVGPSITSRFSGRNQNPLYEQPPKPHKFLLLSKLFKFHALTAGHRLASWLKGKALARFGRSTLAATNPRRVYAVHGSFLCLAQSYFERGGRLECPTFLFCEEIFLAEEASRLGLSVIYDPAIRIEHQEHATTSFLPNPIIRGHLADAHHLAYRLLRK